MNPALCPERAWQSLFPEGTSNAAPTPLPIPERRQSPRFRELACLRATDRNGRQLTGITRDIGPKGVFFLTSDPISCRAHLDLVVWLSAGRVFSQPVRLHCTGEVIRVEQNWRGLRGVAMALDRVDIIHAGGERH